MIGLGVCQFLHQPAPCQTPVAALNKPLMRWPYANANHVWGIVSQGLLEGGFKWLVYKLGITAWLAVRLLTASRLDPASFARRAQPFQKTNGRNQKVS